MKFKGEKGRNLLYIINRFILIFSLTIICEEKVNFFFFFLPSSVILVAECFT